MNYVDNEEYEKNQAQEESGAEESISEESRKKDYFATWEVGGETYRMKLTTPEQLQLEKVYKRNLFALMGDADNLPTLSTMLQITHASMKPFHHGIKLKQVESLYEKYIKEGGSMLQFYVETYMKIFAVSGFFSASTAEEMTASMDKMAEEMK